MTHEHQISVKELFFKCFIHFIGFDSFQIASSIGQKGKRDSCFFQSYNGISGANDWCGSSDKDAIDISDH